MTAPSLFSLFLAVCLASPSALIRADVPSAELVAPLDKNHNVGHSWPGGFRVLSGDTGPIYIAPCFANEIPGEKSWIARPGMQLQMVEGDANALIAETTGTWGSAGEFQYRIELRPGDRKIAMQSRWEVPADAAGMVQTDIRIPSDLASKWTILADGTEIWGAAHVPGSARNAQTVTVLETEGGRELFRVTGDLRTARVFVFDGADAAVILQMAPYDQRGNAGDATDFAWTLEFPE